MGVKEKNITICGHGSAHPSLKNLESYCTQRYNQLAKNGKHKGIIEVRRLKALTDNSRKRFVDTYHTILGRNIYSQDKRQYVYSAYKDGKYYSDCSSSGMATFKKIGYSVPLLNTAGIHSSSLFETVKVKIKNGHITNLEKLKVGDCLLFVGNDPSRPLQIGHVEYVYKIDKSKPKKHSIAMPTLRKGDKGSEVKLLQKNLNECRLFDIHGKQIPKLKVDGVFGVNTFEKLRAFQRTFTIEVDGIYGIESANKMCDVIGNS